MFFSFLNPESQHKCSSIKYPEHDARLQKGPLASCPQTTPSSLQAANLPDPRETTQCRGPWVCMSCVWFKIYRHPNLSFDLPLCSICLICTKLIARVVGFLKALFFDEVRGLVTTVYKKSCCDLFFLLRGERYCLELWTSTIPHEMAESWICWLYLIQWARLGLGMVGHSIDFVQCGLILSCVGFWLFFVFVRKCVLIIFFCSTNKQSQKRLKSTIVRDLKITDLKMRGFKQYGKVMEATYPEQRR